MKTLVKLLFLLIVIIAILFITASILFVNLIHSDYLKTQLSHWVEQKTGRALVIAGEIQPSVFPVFGFKIQNIHLKNGPTSAPKGDFIVIPEAKITLQLMPLLHRKVEIDKIHLQDIQVLSPAEWVGRYDLDVQPQLNPQGKIYNFEKIKLVGRLPRGFEIVLKIQSVGLNLQQNTLTLQDVTANSPSLQGDGNIAFNQINKPLKQWGAQGTFHLDRLMLSQVALNQINAQLTSKNGVWMIAPLSANAYQGTIQGKAVVDLNGAVPKIQTNQTLRNIQVNQLFRSDRLSGNMAMELQLTAQGKTKTALLQSLSGTTQFEITNGALVGMNIGYEIRRALALLRKQPLPATPNSRRTDFSQFTGSGVIKNGVLSNNDLRIVADNLTMTGAGTANLVTKTLNYRLLATVPQPSDSPIKILKSDTLQVPLLVTGTFDHLNIVPDLNALVGNALKQGIELLPRSEEPGNVRRKAREMLLIHRLLQ
ncbi:MAG: AsmA family protein [Gammaproteobacteria bacterium]